MRLPFVLAGLLLAASPPARADELPPLEGVRVVTAPKVREVSAADLPTLARVSKSVSKPVPKAVAIAAPTTSTPKKPARPPKQIATRRPSPKEPLPPELPRIDLPAPNRKTEPGLPAVRQPADLRALTGLRDGRDPTDVALDWLRQLGHRVDSRSIDELVTRALRRDRLRDRSEPPDPGDVLVFERTETDVDLDRIAIVVDRDARGVSEIVYLAGGVIRRGFIDAARPTLHRDDKGRIVNTFVRHVRRWPPRGTRYLAGELLVHVIHSR